MALGSRKWYFLFAPVFFHQFRDIRPQDREAILDLSQNFSHNLIVYHIMAIEICD